MISKLHESYPEEKLSEISTSFCFICLLHLANERGLKLETDAKVDPEREEDVDVGDIWSLKVRTVHHCLAYRFVDTRCLQHPGVQRSHRHASSVATALRIFLVYTPALYSLRFLAEPSGVNVIV